MSTAMESGLGITGALGLALPNSRTSCLNTWLHISKKGPRKERIFAEEVAVILF